MMMSLGAMIFLATSLARRVVARPHLAREHRERRRLARAVDTEQPEALARVEREVDPAHRALGRRAPPPQRRRRPGVRLAQPAQAERTLAVAAGLDERGDAHPLGLDVLIERRRVVVGVVGRVAAGRARRAVLDE